MSHLNALLIALEHVVLLLVELTETLNYLVLAWIVDLLQCFLHLSLQFNVLMIDLGNPLVFGVNQELEILAFLLELPKSSLPLKVTRVSLLFGLYDLVMQLVVFLHQLLILFLEGQESLLVQLLVMLHDKYFVLEFLVALSSLQEVIEELLHKVG